MILVDAILSPSPCRTCCRIWDASLSAGMWVTSAYLLAYAVPLLITGRMGDRFGQKNLYMIRYGYFYDCFPVVWSGAEC